MGLEVPQPELLPAGPPSRAPARHRRGAHRWRPWPRARASGCADPAARSTWRRSRSGSIRLDPRRRRFARSRVIGRVVARLGGAGDAICGPSADTGMRSRQRAQWADDRPPPRLRSGGLLHRIGHPRDDARTRPCTTRSTWPRASPTSPCPPELKEAAKAAIDADINQYAITWGARDFREAIAAKTARWYPGWQVDPETEITVTCGATEGMIAAMLALVEPGRRGGRLRAVLRELRARRDPVRRRPALRDAARAGLAHRPRRAARRLRADEPAAIILNTPHNPTGKVFTRAELELIAGLCQEHDALVLHRRDLRAHRLRRRAHPDGHAPGHARAHGGDQLAVEDVLGDRLAGRAGSIAPPELTVRRSARCTTS